MKLGVVDVTDVGTKRSWISVLDLSAACVQDEPKLVDGSANKKS